LPPRRGNCQPGRHRQRSPSLAYARSQPARFLGYDIIVQHSRTKITGGRRPVNGTIALRVVGPAIQPILLSRRPAVSLTTHGADILAWTDYGWTGPNGVTDYGSERIGNVQDLDILTIEALLEVLDMIPL
jgi:hypothetical protein